MLVCIIRPYLLKVVGMLKANIIAGAYSEMRLHNPDCVMYLNWVHVHSVEANFRLISPVRMHEFNPTNLTSYSKIFFSNSCTLYQILIFFMC